MHPSSCKCDVIINNVKANRNDGESKVTIQRHWRHEWPMWAERGHWWVLEVAFGDMKRVRRSWGSGTDPVPGNPFSIWFELHTLRFQFHCRSLSATEFWKYKEVLPSTTLPPPWLESETVTVTASSNAASSFSIHSGSDNTLSPSFISFL